MVMLLISWGCNYCGWVEQLYIVQEITNCPKCALQRIEVVDPPEVAAAYKLGGWEAIKEIRLEEERLQAAELVSKMRKNFGKWFGR